MGTNLSFSDPGQSTARIITSALPEKIKLHLKTLHFFLQNSA